MITLNSIKFLVAKIIKTFKLRLNIDEKNRQLQPYSAIYWTLWWSSGAEYIGRYCTK
ncbi:hypothetical protein JCM15754A_02520 [Prevotella aurantiaca JCM 15754]